MMEPSQESNGLARRRRSTKTTDTNSYSLTSSASDFSVISVPTKFEPTVVEEEPSTNNDDEHNDGGAMNGESAATLERSSSGNCLDMLLQTASTAMGLRPVHSNNSNGSSSNGSSNNSNSIYAPLTNKKSPQRKLGCRRGSIPSYYTNALHDPTTPNRDSFELKQNAIHSLQSDGTLEQISALENFQSEEQYTSNQNLWRRLAIRSSHPDVTQQELIQRSTFLVISSLTVGAGTLWGGMYVVLGEWTAALMPFIYSTCMSLVLVTFICRSDSMDEVLRKFGIGDKENSRMGMVCIDTYDIYVECQLGLIMACPFAVHVALGGVENSGGVMLWSFLCPMGAAFFRSARESLIWFWIYLSVCAMLLSWEIWNATEASEVITQVYFLMNIMGCMGVVYSAVFLFARELEREYTKSEEVLLNILPSKIVKRIKRGEFPIVDHVSSVTILFADLVGFTKASAELHPNFLVGLFLRDIFHAFDELVGKHGLEKIKTIGDAYMVVGGLDHSDGEKTNQRRRSSMSMDHATELPTYGDLGDHHHPTSIMLFASDMFHELTRINKKYNLNFSLRIGIHKGPVVAGVLGLKRFTYDVWGDSVNTASRMESNGLPNLIHLSSDMYQAVYALTNDFEFTCCGKIQVKGKGEMTTYLARPLR
ncbi:adenylate/guanylate cyclase domain-containing protein [Skeletonema marinoi]|uniref:Adenylate/guanylate cyclase domain-containing protein n=1 Tax=Skeletonema marinoi TaxID=267567 RepID=A0AAD9DA21_9STRA|nr:adenylate/guanylate cyclase domain-containing protein [Skeletonema marinoi]